MSIAIVTLFGNENYGNRLQNYALQKTLSLYDNKVVSIVAKKNSFKRAKKRVMEIAKKIIKIRNRVALQEKAKHHIKKIADLKSREPSFAEFNRKFINLKISKDFNERFSSSLNARYDSFVVGSDQVWNPESFGFKSTTPEFDNYFLRFAHPEKRIAYAASFGVKELPDNLAKATAAELEKFKAISVREQSGAEIVKKLIGIDVPVVLDPTLLLFAQQWRDIESPIVYDGKPYILTYFLGSQTQELKEEIKRAVVESNVEQVDLMDPKDHYYTLGPDSFLWLIDHAKAVYTDSFHGMAFSILFHTPFRVYERQGCMDMSSRIDTLLEKTELKNCVTQKRFPTKEEFLRADQCIAKEREISIRFLENNLQ